MTEVVEQLRRVRAQFIRERVTPVLRECGFQKSSQTYRYLRDGGHQVVIAVRGPRAPGWQLGAGELAVELYVDEGLVVRDWTEFIGWSWARNLPKALRPFEKATEADGPLRKRLGQPGGGDALTAGGMWRFDPSDESAVGRFARLLQSDANMFIEMSDPAAFETSLRKSHPHFRYLNPPAPVLLTVILTGQQRIDEAREALAETTTWFKHDDLAAWVEHRSSSMA